MHPCRTKDYVLSYHDPDERLSGGASERVPSLPRERLCVLRPRWLSSCSCEFIPPAAASSSPKDLSWTTPLPLLRTYISAHAAQKRSLDPDARTLRAIREARRRKRARKRDGRPLERESYLALFISQSEMQWIIHITWRTERALRATGA